MTWNFTSGSAKWRRVKWGLILWLFAIPALANPEDAEFLAFLGSLESSQEATETPVDWEWLLDDLTELPESEMKPEQLGRYEND